MFCKNCGKEIADNAYVCPNCGLKIEQEDDKPRKSKILAIVLGLLLGAFGAHNFYLGYSGRAIAQLLITIFGACIFIGPCISGVWAIIEIILIALGKIKDANGNELE